MFDILEIAHMLLGQTSNELKTGKSVNLHAPNTPVMSIGRSSVSGVGTVWLKMKQRATGPSGATRGRRVRRILWLTLVNKVSGIRASERPVGSSDARSGRSDVADLTETFGECISTVGTLKRLGHVAL
jgi:hypothetical protein